MATISAQGKRRARGRPHGPRRTHGHAFGTGRPGRATQRAWPRSPPRPEPAALRAGPQAGAPRKHAPGSRAGGARVRLPASPGPYLPGPPGKERCRVAGPGALVVTGPEVAEARRVPGSCECRPPDPLFGGTGQEEGPSRACDLRDHSVRKLWALAPSPNPSVCPFLCFVWDCLLVGLCRGPGPRAGGEVGCSVAAPSLGPPPARSRPCTPVQALDQGGWPGALPTWRLVAEGAVPAGLETWWGTCWKLGLPSSPAFPEAGMILFGGHLLRDEVSWPALGSGEETLSSQPFPHRISWVCPAGLAGRPGQGPAVVKRNLEACLHHAPALTLVKKALSLPVPQFPPVNGRGADEKI